MRSAAASSCSVAAVAPSSPSRPSPCSPTRRWRSRSASAGPTHGHARSRASRRASHRSTSRAGGAFDRVALSVGTLPARRRAARRSTSCRTARAARVLGRGALAGGYRTSRHPGAPRGAGPGVGEGARSPSACSNRGRAQASRSTATPTPRRGSSAFRRTAARANVDLSLVFERAEPRASLASELPRMLDRAALFRAQWLGSWAYVMLAAALLVGAPWLVVRALRSAIGGAPPAPDHPR